MDFTAEEIKRVNLLSDKIRNNSALEVDFSEYLTFIEKAKFSKDLILKKMSDAGFAGWDFLKEAREKLKQNEKATIEERRKLEVDLLGYILAFGFAILIDNNNISNSALNESESLSGEPNVS